jgi:hypothetical protein
MVRVTISDERSSLEAKFLHRLTDFAGQADSVLTTDFGG